MLTKRRKIIFFTATLAISSNSTLQLYRHGTIVSFSHNCKQRSSQLYSNISPREIKALYLPERKRVVDTVTLSPKREIMTETPDGGDKKNFHSHNTRDRGPLYQGR